MAAKTRADPRSSVCLFPLRAFRGLWPIVKPSPRTWASSSKGATPVGRAAAGLYASHHVLTSFRRAPSLRRRRTILRLLLPSLCHRSHASPSRTGPYLWAGSPPAGTWLSKSTWPSRVRCGRTQPFQCAVQRFTQEQMVKQEANSGVPYCDGCPASDLFGALKTIAFDPCRHYPPPHLIRPVPFHRRP